MLNFEKFSISIIYNTTAVIRLCYRSESNINYDRVEGESREELENRNIKLNTNTACDKASNT